MEYPIQISNGVGCRLVRLACVAWAFSLSAGIARAQSTVQIQAGGFQSAGQTLFTTDFTQDPLGSFPKGLEYKSGPLDLVGYNGIKMLRAAVTPPAWKCT